MRKTLCALAIFTAATVGAAHANTVTTANVGSTFTVQFDGNINTTNIPDLTSKADFTLLSVVGNVWTFKIDLTVTATNGVTARVSSLGFDTTPNITSATTSGLFNIAVLGGSYPNGFGSIEACFKDGGGTTNCQGGGSGGTFTTGTFTTALNFGSALSSITFDKFGVRYQSIAGVASCGGSTDCSSGTGTGTFVPEPASWLLMIAAFGGLGWQVRRSRHGAARA